MYTLPLQIKKKITFPRLPYRHVSHYEVWGHFKDPSYASGIRNELLEEIKNPKFFTLEEYEVSYDYDISNTYQLPAGIFMDREHKIKVYVDGMLISSLWYTINRRTLMFTINKNKVSMNTDTKIMVKYYKDVITKEYALDKDCTVSVKPVFLPSYHYGDHNVIL